MILGAERRRHHPARGVVPIVVAIFVLVEEEMLNQRLAEHALARRARPRDRLVGVAAGGVHDIERAARHIGDHDGAVGRFTLDPGRARVGVSFRPGRAVAEIMLLQTKDDIAVLGMNERHRAETGAALERAVELVVVDHQRALVGHEMLERVDAVGFDAGLHLVEDLLVPPGDGHVKTVVAGRGFGLAPPILISGQQRLPRTGDAKIHHHCGAAGQRGLAAPFEIVGRNGAHKSEFEVGVRIDTARHHVAAAGVDGFGADRRFQVRADRDNGAVAHDDVGALRVIVIDDGAAAYEFCHRTTFGPDAAVRSILAKQARTYSPAPRLAAGVP